MRSYERQGSIPPSTLKGLESHGDQGRYSMKEFDSVAFMRKAREELSERYENDPSLEMQELEQIREKDHHLFKREN